MCVICGLIQTGSGKYLSLSVDYVNIFLRSGVLWGPPEGAGLRLSIWPQAEMRSELQRSAQPTSF